MFDKVLVANRGEIACRVMRTCRELGVDSVAVYSEADARARHVKLAGEAVAIGPPAVRDSYLHIERIVQAARDTGAQAVHPGYGLLSENAAFARALAAAGIVFIGPSPEVLEQFGDKIAARKMAREVGIQPPPGSDDAIDVSDETRLAREAERIGYPLLVKAAGGGGGIGMKIVKKEKTLMRAVQSCADRGASSFGDARVYLERYVSDPKHIEVQILADTHGTVLALGDRECSMQRRHQKIIEEAPSAAPIFADDHGAVRRSVLHEAAVRLAEHAAYVGAGTVEFVASSHGELFFLEVNARLQVEHPVTEMCTGIDLVEQQLRIASGERLDPALCADGLRGHAVEARIYAEDPTKRFAPQPGHIDVLEWPSDHPGVRIDSGIEQGQEVTPFYDPLLAKVVAHGPDRETAIARLADALAATKIEMSGALGPAYTNVAFCRQLVLSDSFADASYDTSVAEALAKALPKAATTG
jgi:acetyl-CoA carboxylase biotin carboxylase subunit/3-methylcrotonyl-CoA carboxylase alpha subunit